MLHTFHLFHTIRSDLYRALRITLSRLSKENKVKFYDSGRYTWCCELLKDRGINLILKRIENEDGLSYSALEIIMNPARLLNSVDYLQLTDRSHVEIIYKSFKNVFTPIRKEFHRDKRFKHLPFAFDQIDAYKFKRVDFAVNIFTRDIKYYMELITRANIPDGFHQYTEYNETSKRRTPPKDSFYIFRKDTSKKKTLTINCYHKGKQLINQKLPCADEDARYTIRFEVQCGYNKMYNLLKCEEWDDFFGRYRFGSLNALLNRSNKLLLDYFRKTIGIGDYYTLSKAREEIESKRVSQKKKRALLEMLELVSKKRGIWKARKDIPNKNEFDKLINELHKHGVNPVTLPVNWGIDYLPCLFDLEN